MGLVDGPTLLLLLASAISLGLYGVFGVYTVGDSHRDLIYIVLGLAGLWQLFRQPWWL